MTPAPGGPDEASVPIPTPARSGAVSVVIPTLAAEGTLEACLAGLSAQTVPAVEVIVVAGDPDPATTRAICARHAGVRFESAPPELGAHEKRNIGAALARGGILAFTDPDCVADPRWIEALVAAHAAGHAVVGGPVDGLSDARNRAIHLCKYGWWLPGGPAGERPELPSANTSVTRAAWEAHGPYRTDRWAADSELCWRLGRAGVSCRFEPHAVVTHLDHGGRGEFFASRRARGYDYGATRAEWRGWGPWRRRLQALGLPLVPFVMTARAFGYARRAGRAGDWLRALPTQLAAHTCWAWGEAEAYLGVARA